MVVEEGEDNRCTGEECIYDAAQTVDKQEHSAFDTDRLGKFHAAEKEIAPSRERRERQYDQYNQQRQRRLQHKDKFLTEENTPYVLAAICLIYILLHYFKQQKKRQLDEENSRRQLQIVRERNVILDKQKQRLKRLQNEGSKEVADEASELLKDKVILSSDMERNDFKNDNDDDVVGIVNDTNQPQEQTNVSNNSSPARDNDHISKIRAKQQETLVSKTKISKRRERKERLTRMQNSLDHRAADEAHERRMKLIAEEQETLAQYHTNNQHRTYQGLQQAQPRNEAEEAERIALLTEQNAEYQEALQRDQERAQQLALQRERKLARAKAVEEAKQRLVTAGVQCNDYIMVQNHSNDTMGDSVIKVRLLLPSGRRVDAKFTDDHSIGLVYDLALLVLHEENLLWEKQEEESHKVDTISDADTDEDDKSDDGADDISALYDGNDYNVIQEQWAELQFYPFAIVSTFPQKTYDNLSTTLTNCGLRKSAMLMVVVESD